MPSVCRAQACSGANKRQKQPLPSALPCLRSGVVPATGEFVVNEARKRSESTTTRPFFPRQDYGSPRRPKSKSQKTYLNEPNSQNLPVGQEELIKGGLLSITYCFTAHTVTARRCADSQSEIFFFTSLPKPENNFSGCNQSY